MLRRRDAARQDRLHPRPGHRHRRHGESLGGGRHGRRPNELQPRRLRRPRGVLRTGSARPPTQPGGRSASSPTCRGPRSGSAGSRTVRPSGSTARPSASRWRTAKAPTTGSRPPTRTWPRTPSRATGCWSTTARSAVVVEHIDGDDVVCTVTEGGPVSNNKGLSMPGMAFSVPAMSEKDIADLEFALRTRRGPGRAVVRPLAGRRRTGPRGDGPRRAAGCR